VTRRGTRLAAAALVAAALAPAPVLAAPVTEAERVAEADRLAREAERRLVSIESVGGGPQETPALRAGRTYEEGRDQHDRGDWLHAAVLLSEAVDEPAFKAARDHAEATFLLADALRRQGECGAARRRYADYLALGAPDRRGAAVSGALECAVKDRRSGDVDALLAASQRAFAGEPPAEVLYLSAKAIFQRTDLPTAERLARAAAAFARVGAPFEQQAAYFLGVIEIERKNLHGSLQWFDRCARAEPQDERQGEVRELCMLALGRVHAEMGNADSARDWYSAVAWGSARFADASYELAWGYVKGKQYERALRTASFIPELSPDSPLAPEARLLQGHLLLKLGRYAEATDAYNAVINAYAPVRDELDAILSMREDPVRYFNELVGRRGKAFDVAAVLPPVAVRWASSRREVSLAVELVQSLDAARKDVQDSADVAARVEVLLARGAGLDAFPALQRAYAAADAVENDAARIEGDAVAALSAIAERTLQPDAREALLRARAARVALESRMAPLPRTGEAAEERRLRMRRRLEHVDAETFRTGFRIEGLAAMVNGTEAWIERHRADIDSDPDGRQELAEELRRHREVIEGYAVQLRALKQEITRVRDTSGGADALADESRIRADYLEAIEAERVLADKARGSTAGPDAGAFERADAVRGLLAGIRSRARSARLGYASEASRRAGELRDRLSSERVALAAQEVALDGVQAAAKELVGRIAVRALGDVRAQFYALVLKADVGVVDVAWSRKRVRLEKIQQLSVQKASELDQLEREYRALTREQE
jgi:tetratricopeptide (TPR) repeat protein